MSVSFSIPQHLTQALSHLFISFMKTTETKKLLSYCVFFLCHTKDVFIPGGDVECVHHSYPEQLESNSICATYSNCQL